MSELDSQVPYWEAAAATDGRPAVRRYGHRHVRAKDMRMPKCRPAPHRLPAHAEGIEFLSGSGFSDQ